MNLSTRQRLVSLQSTEELARKASKATRKGYGKEGSFYRATVENYELNHRVGKLVVF